MADFRKLFLVLAVLAIAVAPASAQLACTARATPAQLRAEGLTEAVGDTFLECRNDVARTISVEAIITETNISNRITNSATQNVDAYLIVQNEDGTLASGSPIAGKLTSDNSIVWESIQIPAVTAPATLVLLRITNIRVNANFAGVPTGGQAEAVTETVSVNGTNVLDVQNPVLRVGTVRRGLNFSVIGTTDFTTAFGTASFQACNGLNVGAPDGTAADGISFRLRFDEGVSTTNAFKTSTGEQNFIPQIAAIATVTNGTRLQAKFAGVPTGVRIYVSAVNVDSDTITDTTLDTDLDIVTALRTDGVGSAINITAGGVTASYRPVTISSTGAGSATWDVTGGTNASRLERAVFNVIVSFPPTVNVPVQTGPTAPVTVGGTFAPTSTVINSDTTSNIVRFADTAVPQNVFTFSACVTNLLFPFVTNQAGFDTGVAIVNTSKDNAGSGLPFNTTNQSGACTVYYFGSMGNGSQVPAPQTTTSIAAGDMRAFSLQAGGVPGSTGATTFQGYLIVRCNFQYAHGFAFISDIGASKVSHGYLALVIPDRGSLGRPAVPFTVGGGAGEQLAQ